MVLDVASNTTGQAQQAFGCAYTESKTSPMTTTLSPRPAANHASTPYLTTMLKTRRNKRVEGIRLCARATDSRLVSVFHVGEAAYSRRLGMSNEIVRLPASQYVLVPKLTILTKKPCTLTRLRAPFLVRLTRSTRSPTNGLEIVTRRPPTVRIPGRA